MSATEKSLRAVQVAIVLALIAVVGVVLPGAAFAAPGNGVPAFTVHGSNGYRITVSALKHRDRNHVTLTARKGTAYATYSVRGVARGGIVKAKFPGLGRVSVKFQSAQRNGRLFRSSCTHGRRGKFVGTIRFHGEGGFTSVSAKSANGAVSGKAHYASCRSRGSVTGRASKAISGSPGGPRTTFELYAVSGESRLAAIQKLGDESASFSAVLHEEVEGMEIWRANSGEGAGFAYAEDLSQATLDPGSPFSGSATFSAEDHPVSGLESSERTGTLGPGLSVLLPGKGSYSWPETPATLSRNTKMI
jgi:hypothetical protein